MGSTGRRLTKEERSEIRRKYSAQEATFGELQVEFALTKGGLSHVLADLPKTGLKREKPKVDRPKLPRRRPTSEQLSLAAKLHWVTRHFKTQFSELRKDCTRRHFIVRECGHQCQVCQNSAWQDSPIPLELDHIDGNPENNTRENCRIICPNCHAQTETYKGRNVGRVQNSKRQAVMARSIGKYR